MGPDIVKRLLYVLASLFFLSTTITAVAQDESKNPIIESIEVIAANDKPEQVVFKLNGSHAPKIFKLNGDNPRLVLDFYGIKYPSRIDRISDVGGDIIAGVRVGRHTDPERTRVVVDIQQDSPYQYDKTFNVSNNNLVVTLVPDFEAIAGEQQATSQPQRIVVDSPKVVHTPSTAPVQPPSTAPVPPVQPESPEPVEVAQEQTRDGQSDEGQAVAEVSAESTKTILKPDQPASVVDDTTGPETPTMEQEAEQTPTLESAEQQAEQTPTMQPSEQEAGQTSSMQSSEKDDGQTASAEVSQGDEPEQKDGQQSTQIEDIKPVLLDVSFEKSINGSETVMFRLNHFYPPLVFGVEKGEPRVICHFLDASIGENIPPEIEAGGQFVSRITIAEEPDPAKVRVELVLVPTRNYDLQQLFFKEDNLFVIIVKELQNGSEVSN